MASGLLPNILAGANPLEDPNKRVTGALLQSILAQHGVNIGVGTTTGKTITPDSAMRMIAVARAASLLGGLLGSLPLKAFDADKNTQEVPVLENRRPGQTKFEFFEQVGMDLARHGNFYARKVVWRGQVIELQRMTPARWEPGRVEPTPQNPSGKVFKDLSSGELRTDVEIFHIPLYSTDGVTGLSPIGLAREAVASALSAEEFANKLWASGGLIQGILQTEQKLGEEKAKALKQRWMAKIGGVENAYDVAVLDAGIKFERISMPPQDMQFLETRKFQVNEIARLYGLPPHLLSQQERQTSWGTGIEQNNIGFVVYTLEPTWFTRVEQRVTMELLPAGLQAEYVVQGLMRGDSAARADFYKTLYEIKSMSPNEIRERESLPPRDGGDDFFDGDVSQESPADDVPGGPEE
jgi:HK97 family phage portal protein